MVDGRAAIAAEATIALDISDVGLNMGIDPAQLEDELTTHVNDALDDVDLSTYLVSLGAANDIASKGLGVDYASMLKAGVVGVGGGVAFNSEGATSGLDDLTDDANRLRTRGFGFQASVMGGVNFAWLPGPESGPADLGRVTLFANYMAVRSGPDAPYQAQVSSVGVHLKYKVFPPVETSPQVTWIGMDAITGWERSTYTTELTSLLGVDTTFDRYQVSWIGSGGFDATLYNRSIPLEVSTGLRVLVVTLYSGLGLDFSKGGAEAEVRLDGDLEATIPDVVSETQDAGSASVTISDSAEFTGTARRLFLGLQLDILWCRVYAHGNISTNRSAGAHAGIRLAL